MIDNKTIEIEDSKILEIKERNKDKDINGYDYMFIVDIIMELALNQKVTYKCSSSLFSYNQQMLLSQFGFVFKGIESKSIARKYFIVISSESTNIRTSIIDFYNDNLPSDVEFVGGAKTIDLRMVIDSEEEQEILRIEEQIYARCGATDRLDEYVKSKLVTTSMNYLRKELESLQGYDLCDITSYIDLLYDNIGSSTLMDVKAIEIINGVMSSIIINYPKTRTSLIMHGTSLRPSRFELYCLIATKLYYEYGYKIFIPGDMRAYFNTSISETLFPERQLLLEDKLDYVNGLPSIMVDEQFGITSYLIGEKNFRLEVVYSDFATVTDDLVSTVLDKHTLKLLRIKDIFDLKSSDTFRETHDSLMEKIIKLEDKLNLSDKMLTIHDLVLFSLDNTIKIGYIKDFDVKVSAYGVSLTEQFPIIIKSLDLASIRFLKPLDLYLDGPAVVTKSIQLFMQRKVISQVPKLQYSVFRFDYKGKELLMEYDFDLGADIRKCGIDLLTISLFHKAERGIREILNNTILEVITKQGIRTKTYVGGKEQYCISAFGGISPVMGYSFVVTEKLFRRGPIAHDNIYTK